MRRPGRRGPNEPFTDRTAAGEALAARIIELGLERPIVLGLPRGGVPVARVIADRLEAPLDVWVARKVSPPGRREYGIGAIAEGGGSVLDRSACAGLAISEDVLADRVEEERGELERRVRVYRGDRARPDIAGRDVIVVDDGLATGVTAEAAIDAIRRQDPRSIVLAVAVAAPDSVARLGRSVDVITVMTPDDFVAVGRWYVDFSPTSDEEVIRLLDR